MSHFLRYITWFKSQDLPFNGKNSKTCLFLFYKICIEINLCCLMAFVLSFHWHTPLTVDRNFFNNTKCNNGISISHKCQQILGTNSDLLKRHSRSYAPPLSLTTRHLRLLPTSWLWDIHFVHFRYWTQCSAVNLAWHF